MQGVLPAAKLHTSTQPFSKASFGAGTRTSAFLVNKQGSKVTPARPQGRASRGAQVAAAASSVAEPSTQAVSPVALPPPSRKVKKSINDAELHFKFVVPNSLVGAFLGKNGSTVNKVKEQTGVYVQFTKPGTAVNTERDRMLILASDTVEQAKQALSLLLEGVMQVEGAVFKLRTPMSGERLFLQQIIPAVCAGNIMGPGGETIKSIGFRTGSSLLVEPKLQNAAFIPFRIVDFAAPDTASLSLAVGEVMDRLVQDEKYAEGIRDVQSVCMRIIQVPQARVGAILGPAGQHIKAMQEMLKVKIGVAEAIMAEGSTPVRHVTFWGSPLNVKVAIDCVLLATGQLQSEMEKRLSTAGAESQRGTPRSRQQYGSEDGSWTPRSASGSTRSFASSRPQQAAERAQQAQQEGQQ